MSIKDLIQSALNKDATTFEETFADIMAEKQEAAIASKYDSMFESKDEDDMDDEDMDDEDKDDDDEDED